MLSTHFSLYILLISLFLHVCSFFYSFIDISVVLRGSRDKTVMFSPISHLAGIITPASSVFLTAEILFPLCGPVAGGMFSLFVHVCFSDCDAVKGTQTFPLKKWLLRVQHPEYSEESIFCFSRETSNNIKVTTIYGSCKLS